MEVDALPTSPIIAVISPESTVATRRDTPQQSSRDVATPHTTPHSMKSGPDVGLSPSPTPLSIPHILSSDVVNEADINTTQCSVVDPSLSPNRTAPVNKDGQNAGEFVLALLEVRKREGRALAERTAHEKAAAERRVRAVEDDCLIAVCEANTVARHRLGSWLEGQWALQDRVQAAAEARKERARKAKAEEKARYKRALESDAATAADEVMACILKDLEKAATAVVVPVNERAVLHLNKHYELPGLAPPERVFAHLSTKLHAAGLLGNTALPHDMRIALAPQRAAGFLAKPRKLEPSNWSLDTHLEQYVFKYEANAVEVTYIAAV